MRNLTSTKLVVLCTYFFIVLHLDSFAQAPTITGFNPKNAAAGETVVITGTNFSGVTGVNFGTTPAASFVESGGTRITAVVGTGSSGNISVAKTGQTTATFAGFTFSTIPTVTRMITDFGGFWSTNTTTNSGIFPNDAHNLLAFTYGGTVYSTGVNNAALSGNGVAYTASSFKALPVIMSGTTSGSGLYIAAAAKMDGNTTSALYTHPNIKDLTIESVLSDGLHGLNIGTGYTNLPTSAVSNFNINSIQSSKVNDSEPDLIVTQIADPSNSAFDTYRFVDASGSVVGTSLQIDLSKLSALGTYRLDLFTVANNVPFSQAKPTSVFSTNTTREIRLMAFKLSDFGITAANYTQVKRLQILPSGSSDAGFVAYNTSAVNVPPSIAQNTSASSSAICNPGGGSAVLAVNATAASGGALSYGWEVSTNGGTNWSAITNGGIYSGATSTTLNISSASINYQYRATVTEAGSGYSATSPVFTITGIVNTALAGTLNPTGFTNCVNASTGTTTLSVAPTGGTGTYSYQWSSSTTATGTYTPVSGAVYSSFSPPLTTAGVLHYRVQITSGCLSNVSNSAQVTVNGADITSVTNGSSCSEGAVALAATASGGTINWYTASTGGGSIGTGSPFNTPSIATTTTYYVGTTVGGCSSNRQAVVATVANTVTLSSSNFNMSYASNVCSGSGSNITFTSSALIDGDYQVTYSVTGTNAVTNATTTVSFTGGSGHFTTQPLLIAGNNTIVITGVRIGSCNVAPSSGHSRVFSVNAASPNALSFNVSVANGCSNEGSLATVSSSSLTGGTYVVTYNISGSNPATGATAQIAYTAGSPGNGSFRLPALVSTGNNVLTITSIALLTSPDCSTALSASSNSFVNNTAVLVDAGTPKSVCASDPPVNITGGSMAENYTALTWSTPNGSGTFTNNNTAQALSATTYTPGAADVTRSFAYITLTGTAASGCAAVAKTITLTVNPAVVGGTVNNNQTIPAGAQPASLTVSGNSGSVVRWQRSADAAFSAPTDIANTSPTLTGAQIGTLSTTTHFRAICQSGDCSPVASSYATVTISGSLPVTLISFTQQCNGNAVLLQWATASETNNKVFTVERSSNQVNWSAIKDLPGAGNSNIRVNYSYSDLSTNGASYYYRLKQTDLDGTTSYSAILKSDCSAAFPEIIITPNPGRDVFEIRNLPVRGVLNITDMKGKLILPQVQYSGSTCRVSLAGFSPGVYAVTIYANGKATTKRLLKE